jgi:hypothetical protein
MRPFAKVVFAFSLSGWFLETLSTSNTTALWRRQLELTKWQQWKKSQGEKREHKGRKSQKVQTGQSVKQEQHGQKSQQPQNPHSAWHASEKLKKPPKLQEWDPPKPCYKIPSSSRLSGLGMFGSITIS